MYASASPEITAAIFAPAEPIGTTSPPTASATASSTAGGRVRLATMRIGPPAAAEPDRGGYAGGKSVPSTRSWSGSPMAAAASWYGAFDDRTHSAMCTAQSDRPSSPNSRVPSSGSTIQSRSAFSRAGSSCLPSSDSTASAGRHNASCAAMYSCDSRSPKCRSSSGSSKPTCSRNRRSSSPAPAASQRANAPSTAGAIATPPYSATPPSRCAAGSLGQRESSFAHPSVRGDSGAVVTVLCRLDAELHDRLDHVRRAIDEEVELLALRRGEVRQHIVGRVHPAGRAPDAEPYPRIFLRSERFGHRSEPVVTALAAADLRPYRPEVEVELVVYCNDPIRRNLVEAGEVRDRRAKQVHEGRRLRDHELRSAGAQKALGQLGCRAPGSAELRADTSRQKVGHEEAGVVPVAGVVGTGVAEPDDQPCAGTISHVHILGDRR